ncbi:hypothetical protein D9619_006800 [Psilocybe cf. subviscida]|uniref:Hydrophobin n=1 Tax=Psilocybe cf. subviscida TaxID=2480587 RepID=A0A8H5B5Z7_9AGAR|nr:hypothetical protein D9619_006800 [Psilocybe cf. subviscida]
MRASFALLALPVLAAATAVPRTDGSGPSNQCNGGTLQCCNSVQSASNPLVGLLAGLLGIVLGPITGQVGLTCSPLSVVGISGTSCSQQSVCCTGNNFNGAIVVGCTPININL